MAFKTSLDSLSVVNSRVAALTATYATAAGGGCREHLLAQSSVGASGSAAATANDKRSQVRVTVRYTLHYPFVTL